MPRLLRFTRSECSILFTPFNFPPVAAETWSWKNFFRLSTFSIANGWDVAIPQGTWLLASNSARIAVGKPAQVFNVCECFPFHGRGAPYSTHWIGECLESTVYKIYWDWVLWRSQENRQTGFDGHDVEWMMMNDVEEHDLRWSQHISSYHTSYHIISYLIKLLLTASLFVYQTCIRWSACR